MKSVYFLLTLIRRRIAPISLFVLSVIVALLAMYTSPADAYAVSENALAVDPAKVRSLGFTKILMLQRQESNSSHVYTYHQESLAPGGGLWICDLSSDKPVMTKIFDSSEGEIIDLNLHYDGQTILFSWKPRMSDFFQLYTIDLSGNNLTQLTFDPSNNFNGCWTSDGGIVFLSDRKPAFAYCWNTTTPILWRCNRDGSGQKRISANYLNDFTPSVLADGRILYSRWEYVDRPAIPIQSLWTMFPDGTQVSGFFGNRVLSPATFMDARGIPGREGQVLCVLTAHNGPCRGAIGIIETNHGPNAQKGITNITPEVSIDPVDVGDGNNVNGPYLNPFPLDDNYYLVSKRGEIQLRDYSIKEIYCIVPPAEMGFYNPQPIRTRPMEQLIPSMLTEVAENNSEQQWASLYMQDVYVGLEGYVERGEIKKIAIVQEVEKPVSINPNLRAFGFQFPVVSAGATYAPKKIWGYADVEADGSAHFMVPALEPIYFLPLDEEGRAVQRMRTFTHLMPGEKQGCIGCHADRNTISPSNAGIRAKALIRAPQQLTEPEWGVTGFCYSSLIQPIWDNNCIQCHGHSNPAAGLELTNDKTDFFNISYENLVRKGTSAEEFLEGEKNGRFAESKYTSWIPTYNGQEANILRITPGEWGAKASLLANVIRKEHKDGTGKERIKLTDYEKKLIYTWLDLNVPYYPTSSSNYEQNRGCRQMIPTGLNELFAEVAKAKCIACHNQKGAEQFFSYPGNFALRIDHPELNPILMAPLAVSAGGSGKCSTVVFKDRDDPDYKRLINTFKEMQQKLHTIPRMDMIGIYECLPAEREANSFH